MDFIFVTIIVGFFAFTVGLVYALERLLRRGT
jgi:hypothetical protein